MRLTELIQRTAFLDCTGLRKEEAIARLLLHLAETEAIPLTLVPDLLQIIRRREGLGSTGIGQGLAFPHAIHPAVENPIGILAVCRPRLAFESIDGEPVDLLTLILSSSASARPRLRGLETLFRAFREETFTTMLRAATTPDQLRDVLCGWDDVPVPSTEPQSSPAASWPGLSTRKARFFACACARRLWDRLEINRQQAAIELVERVLDHQAAEFDLIRCRQELLPPTNDTTDALVQATLRLDPLAILGMSLVEAPGQGMAAAEQAVLLLDIWGPSPSKWPKFDLTWRTWKDGTIPRVAAGIYEAGDFDSLPILADALEDAGCEDEGILAHLRGPGPHFHGCWVLDLLLGERSPPGGHFQLTM